MAVPGSGVAAYLGLGSNVGDRAGHLAFAVDRLRGLGTVDGVSDVYETDPVGHEEQRRFLNLVVRLHTLLGPRALLDRARSIETERGRERTFRNAPRSLDIDLLLYGDRVVDEEGVTVPHPRMTERPFVLVPLLELAPDVEDPRTGQRLTTLDAASPHTGMDRIMAGEELLDATDG